MAAAHAQPGGARGAVSSGDVVQVGGGPDDDVDESPEATTPTRRHLDLRDLANARVQARGGEMGEGRYFFMLYGLYAMSDGIFVKAKRKHNS